MNNSFAIIGAGGHAKVIIEIIEEMKARVQSITDPDPKNGQLLGYQVSAQEPSDVPVIVAVGNNAVRKQIVADRQSNYGTAIHPSANLSSRCKIDVGTVVMAGATINSDTRVGQHCIVNTNASIDHDCLLEDFVHISPNAALAGNVTIGEGTHVGIGSTVIQGITIGKWVTIGAGSVVIKDVPDYAVVVGVPGTVIKIIKG